MNLTRMKLSSLFSSLLVVSLLSRGMVAASTALEVGTIEIMTIETCRICKIEDCKRVDVASFRIPKSDKTLFIYFGDTYGAKNGPIDVYLLDKGKCTSVLSAEGSGAWFTEKSRKSYPNVKFYWHIGADSGPVTEYAWDGHRYKKIRTTKLKKDEKPE